MGAGRAAALLSRSSSALHSAAVLSHHLSFRPLLSLRPFRGGAGASSSSSVVRMASDAASPQKESSPASAASSAGAQGSSSSSSTSSTSPSSAVDFLTLCHRLKTTKRAGWVRHSIREPESVADHMYRMGVMALISSDLPGVDRERCIKMAIVHDIAEAIVGDITPADGVPKLEKSQREQEALAHMCGLLGDVYDSHDFRVDIIFFCFLKLSDGSTVNQIKPILWCIQHQRAWPAEMEQWAY